MKPGVFIFVSLILVSGFAETAYGADYILLDREQTGAERVGEGEFSRSQTVQTPNIIIFFVLDIVLESELRASVAFVTATA